MKKKTAKNTTKRTPKGTSAPSPSAAPPPPAPLPSPAPPPVETPPDDAAPPPVSPQSELEQAIAVRDRAVLDINHSGISDRPKHIDAWTRAANVVRQLEKDRKRAIASFSDDELVEYIKSLPERRRDAIRTAAQGASLAGKPLFG